MTRRLTLLRHGQAAPATTESAGSAGGDFGRVLTKTGEREAWESAMRIASLSPPPARVLTSDAPRARRTAGIALDALGLPMSAFTPEPSLYLAEVRTLLDAIAAVDERCLHLLVVGHNPGLSELVHALAPGSAFGSLATGAWCTLHSPAQSWSLLEAGRMSLERSEAPGVER